MISLTRCPPQPFGLSLSKPCAGLANRRTQPIANRRTHRTPDHTMIHPTASPFTDPAAVARYAEGPRRNVPGYDSLLRMSRILLAERVPANGRVLVVGAGGGLELEDMALAHPGWRFDGVDPSQPMLDLAAQRLQSAGVAGDRVALHRGYVQSAPAGPFDGATCLLTFHFVPCEERVPMAVEIRRRLKPRAPLVVAHFLGWRMGRALAERAGQERAICGCRAMPRFRWLQAWRRSTRPGRGTRWLRSWRC